MKSQGMHQHRAFVHFKFVQPKVFADLYAITIHGRIPFGRYGVIVSLVTQAPDTFT